MNKTLFVQPAAATRRTLSRSLSRVWIATGNPRRPLAAVWVDGEISATRRPEASDEPGRWCA